MQLRTFLVDHMKLGFVFWSTPICLFIGVFKLLMLKVITDIVGLVAIIVATVFYFFVSLFFCLSFFFSFFSASSGFKYFV